MTTAIRRWWFVLVGGALGAILAVADLAWRGVPTRAATTFAIVLGYSLIVAMLQTRSETASALAGRPVDERWAAINVRALAISGQLGAFVALGGFVAAELTGADGSQFALVGAVVGFAYIGTIVWYRLRA